MKFEEAVALIGTMTDLRRVAGAHVIDHNQLKDDQLRAALVKAKPQYTDAQTIHSAVNDVLHLDQKESTRVLSRLILVDVVLNQYDCDIPFSDTESKVLAAEQLVLDRSNEVTLEDMSCGDKDSTRGRELEIYNFVLAWLGNLTIRCPRTRQTCS